MKKSILFALLVSLLIIGGGYYYFYILHPLEEEPKFPTKQRIVIQKPITNIQQKSVAKVEEKKGQPKPEVKKEEPKKVEVKKAKEPKLKGTTKEIVETKEAKKPKATIEKKEEKIEVAKKEQDKKQVRRPKGYILVYVVSTYDEALKIKNDLTEKGYHTAKTGKHGGKDAVIVSPFTDKWEADYVMKSIVKDTGIKGFKVVASY